MITKPKLIENIIVDGKVTGAIMRDNVGYFYRPKRSAKITVGKRDEKWDGCYCGRLEACRQVVLYGKSL